jgi:hypothetical protein
MRWYVNDTSLQGQYAGTAAFLTVLGGLVAARNRFPALGASLHTTRSFPNQIVGSNKSLREFLKGVQFRDIRGAVFLWLDKTGPFVDDDRQPEPDDYFECLGHDVTEAGIGEAARRIKHAEVATTFSFPGGDTDFCISPLLAEHGLVEHRLGQFKVPNLWTLEELVQSAQALLAPPSDWKELVEFARESYPRLNIPDSVYTNPVLVREPFDSVVADRALRLWMHLDTYMLGRSQEGAEGPKSRAVIDQFFVGERALYSGESQVNQRKYQKELTFADPDDPKRSIFAHWHGKISHRFFRMHFEWPAPATAVKLKIVYLGPKITKS